MEHVIHKPYRGFVIDHYPWMGRFQVCYHQTIEPPHHSAGHVIYHVFGWHDSLGQAKSHVDRLVKEACDDQPLFEFGRN